MKKRFVALFMCMTMLCMATVLCPALAEAKCLHENVYELVSNEVRPRAAGHENCKVITAICQDCKTKYVDERFESFKGHVFHMAESLHFEEDGMHLWVFICSECMYITMIEDACTGGANCMLYSAQAGVRPAVQYADSLAAWKDENEKNDIVARWLAGDYNQIWMTQNGYQ